jgi:dihydroorotase
MIFPRFAAPLLKLSKVAEPHKYWFIIESETMDIIRRISGTAVLPDGARTATVEFDEETGIISSVIPSEEGTDNRYLIFPGFVDIHVHAREYPEPPSSAPADIAKWEAACKKETFRTAGQAAIHGGVVMYAAMPNDALPPFARDTYELKAALAKTSQCPVVLYAAVTQESEPWADIPYKVYTDAHATAFSFNNRAQMEQALRRYRGCRVFFHAEDPAILRAQPRHVPRWSSRPPEAEINAVEHILELTAKYSLRTHICHVSTRRTVELVEEYNRTASEPISTEVTPHHLYFSVSKHGTMTATGAPLFHEPSMLDCNPPLRSEDDRRYLVEALKEGRIDILASDHAPHTLEDKAQGAPGMPHLDTLGPFVGRLIKSEGFGLLRVADMLARKPAAVIGEHLTQHLVGGLEAGSPAALTVLDLHTPCVIEADGIKDRGAFRTKCGWSPFSGSELPASVESVVINGSVYR